MPSQKMNCVQCGNDLVLEIVQQMKDEKDNLVLAYKVISIWERPQYMEAQIHECFCPSCTILYKYNGI